MSIETELCLQIAELKLELLQATARYEMCNRALYSRAEERENIARQLSGRGIFLHANGTIIEVKK